MKAELLASITAEVQPMLDALGSRRIVVWGAGELGRWLMQALGPAGVCFVDTNPTKVGTSIIERAVHHPNELEQLEFDQVWIAVLSDGAGVGEVLSAREIPFQLAFPGGKQLQVRDQLKGTLEFLQQFDLEGREVLEIGCGGQLFLALTMVHLGATRVLACDVGPLGDVLQSRRETWLEHLALLESVRPRGHSPSSLLDRIEVEARAVDAAELPYADASFDVVANTGVMEHVDKPEAAVHDFARVLRPDGLALCLAIGIHDHRANDPDSGFTPWSFLQMDSAAWEALGSGAYHQNRWRAKDFVQAYGRAGFEICAAKATRDPRLGPDEVSGFAAEFRERYSTEELAELDLSLGGRKL